MKTHPLVTFRTHDRFSGNDRDFFLNFLVKEIKGVVKRFIECYGGKQRFNIVRHNGLMFSNSVLIESISKNKSIFKGLLTFNRLSF